MSSKQTNQNIVVMRHGDRIDDFDPLWTRNAARPWDPPLILDDKLRAFSTGKKLNNNLGFPIHRVFVSPFLRFLQTASEVIHALCTVDDDRVTYTSSADGVVIDPSKLKVSVELGLGEALNAQSLRPRNTPNGDFGFIISECEAVLPKGTVDSSVESVYKELPKLEEFKDGARARYKDIIKMLADIYPNLMVVTHAEGVWVSANAYWYLLGLLQQQLMISHVKEPELTTKAVNKLSTLPDCM